MRFLSKASMMMVVERRMDQPAALGWRARDVKRLWSGCGLWDGFVAVVAAAVASAWMGLGVACIEVWKNGVFLVWGAREDAVFLIFFFLHTFRSRISCRMAVFSSSTAKAAIENATDAYGGLELDVYRASVLRMEKSLIQMLMDQESTWGTGPVPHYKNASLP